ncbi:MAG: pantoate--beta-alanine ligase [Bacteroidetes bacterium]|nr:MAG: pantoate--beta-alanine ligase [Bacteroidota bacterium]
MKVFDSKAELQKELKDLVIKKNKIGFVPTMGALHKGHISLIEKSVSENNITVVSIFVNPNQFNDKKDLENYPRFIEKDLDLLKNTGCDFVFTPSVNEIYPEEDKRVFDFGELDKVMEGKHRAGHFNGVAQVVSKLFNIVNSDVAYFGRKDFQQYVIIKKMVKMLDMPIEIVACPIVREPDGLAMSSRNLLLSDEQRKNSAFISEILFKARNLTNELSVKELKNWVVNTINQNPFLDVEYFDIVDDIDLKSINNWNENNNKVGCIAVKVGKIRLIDNVNFNL